MFQIIKRGINKMAKTFIYNKNIYSVSDRNALGEFVVVKFSFDAKNVVDKPKVIKAKSEKEVEKFVRTYEWYRFKNLPDEPILH
jgi:hypothetical protein